MRYDWEDIAFIGIIIAGLCLIVFLIFQGERIDDCTKRGGTAIKTTNGWICGKVERI